MAGVVGELPILDEFAILDAESNLREVSRILMNPNVKLIFVRDPSINRIVGIMNENMFLQVIASGINPSRTKLATHMLPNKKSKRGLLRLTKDAPVLDAYNLARDTNPFAIIVEERLHDKSLKGDSKSQILGYISPNDLKSSITETVNNSESIVKKSKQITDIESNFKPVLEAAPALYRTVKDISQKSNDSTIGQSTAEQMLSLAYQIIPDTHDEKTNGQFASSGGYYSCIVTHSSQISSVWPISVSEITNFSSTHTIYKVSWADNLLNFSGEGWVNFEQGKKSGNDFSIMAIVSSRIGRFNHIHEIVNFDIKCKSNSDLVQQIASKINSLEHPDSRVLICIND